MENIIQNQLVIRQVIVFLAIGGGIFSIFLGYRLFIHGVSGKFKFKSDLRGLKADLVSASPGLFFALLGAFIVWSSLHHGFEIKVDSKPRDLEPIKVHSSIGNSGWTLVFDIIGDKPVKEIFYRFGDEETFKSTGFSQARDRTTGLPEPRYSVEIPYLKGKRTLLVKYTDSTGHNNGPYTLTFDATEQLVAWTKEVLELTENFWLAFREYPKGEMSLYFSHLLSYKNGLKEIRYSVDDESLSRRVQFAPDWSGPGAPGISDDDEILVEIPISSRFVYVKLIFIDGSEWPAKKFTIAQAG